MNVRNKTRSTIQYGITIVFLLLSLEMLPLARAANDMPYSESNALEARALNVDQLLRVFTAPVEDFNQSLKSFRDNNSTLDIYNPQKLFDNVEGKFKEVTGLNIRQFLRAIVGIVLFFLQLLQRFFNFLLALVR